MAVDLLKGWGHSVLAGTGPGAGHSLAPLLTADRAAGHSVFAAFRSLVPDRVIGVRLAVRESLPNTFYGIVETDSAEFEIPNFDRTLTFLRTQVPYRAPVRVRQLDLKHQERSTVFEGAVTSMDLGRTITLRAKAVDLASLGVALPRNRIVDTANPPPEGVLPHDVTTTFANPPDAGAGIPIVFGRTDGVACACIRRDDEQQQYEYLVCEDVAAVEAIEKFSNGAWHAGFTSTGNIIRAGDTNDNRGYALLPATNPWGSGTFTNLLCVLTNGLGAGQSRRIVAHYADEATVLDQSILLNIPLPTDAVPKLVVLDKPFSTIPDIFTQFEIREYETLAGGPYARRTAIRFYTAQLDEDTPKRIRARVAQFHFPQKNLLAWTDRFDRYTTGTTPGWWRHVLGGTGQGQFSLTGFSSTGFASVGPGGTTVAFQSQSQAAPYGAPVDVLGAVQIPGGATAGYCMQETGFAASNGSYTFSGWLLSADTTTQQVCGFVQLSDGSGRSEFTVTAAPTMGTRFTHTVAYNSPGLTVQVGFFGLSNTTVFVAPFALQLERSAAATYPEQVEAPTQGRHWSFPNAIRRLLTDPVYGVGNDIAIVPASFETANENLWPLWLTCRGALPDAAGEGGQLPDVLNELLQVRGMFLRPAGGALALDTDHTTLPSVATVGFGAAVHEPLLTSVGTVQYPEPLNLVQAVNVYYGLTNRPQEDTAEYFYRLTKTIGTAGAPTRDLSLRFVQDHNTADRALQYLSARLAAAETWEIEATSIARAWRVKDVLSVVAWEQQVENLLRFSDDLTVAIANNPAGAPELVWFVTGTATRAALTDPEGRARIATQLGAGTIAKQQIVNTLVATSLLYVTVWVYSDQVSAIRLAVEDSGVELKAQAATTGPGWQAVTILYEFTGTPTTPAIALTVTGSAPVSVCWPHVRRTYDYAYTPTTNAVISAADQQQWQIAEITRGIAEPIKVRLIPYRPTSLYAFTPSDYSTATITRPGVDSTLLAPLPVTDVVLPPSPGSGIPTALAGVDIAQDGTTISWAILQFLKPDDIRIQRVEAQIRKLGDPAWQTAVSVPVADVPPGTPVSAYFGGLIPGLIYEIRFLSVSFHGLVSGTQLTNEFIAYGDTTPPPPPTGAAVQRGTGKALTVTVFVNNDPVTGVNKMPGDWAGIRVYRAETLVPSPAPAASSFVAVAEQPSLLFQDAEVEYLRYYWYKVTTFDYSGNESTAFGPTAPIQAALIDGGVEIADDTITAAKIRVRQLAADRLIIGSLDNLIENPGFEYEDPTVPGSAPGWQINAFAGGWSIPLSPTGFVGGGAPRSGIRAAEATATGGVASLTRITAFEGDPIVAEAYARLFGTITGQVQFVVGFYDAMGAALSIAFTTLDSSAMVLGTWHKLQVFATAPVSVAYFQVGIGVVNVAGAGAFVFDDLYARRRVGSAEIYNLTVTGATGTGVDAIKILRGPGSELVFATDTGTPIATIDVHATLDHVNVRAAAQGQGQFNIGVRTGADDSRFEIISLYSTGYLVLNSDTGVLIVGPELSLGCTTLRADSLVLLGTQPPLGQPTARLLIRRGATDYWAPLYPFTP